MISNTQEGTGYHNIPIEDATCHGILESGISTAGHPQEEVDLSSPIELNLIGDSFAKPSLTDILPTTAEPSADSIHSTVEATQPSSVNQSNIESTRVRNNHEYISSSRNHFNWRWECASLVLSICCNLLIVSILFTMNGKPLSKWKLPIQPNSLIALFSTISKSAMLFPLSECLGQLKWHYLERTLPLKNMDDIDRASRGPWGSAQFLYIAKRRYMLASLGAAVTVFALGLEPFTQQVIGFSTRNAPLSNTFGYITRTDTYINFTTNFSSWTDSSPYMDYSLHRGLLSIVAQAGDSMNISENAFCPTMECSFPDFTSLAACATCSSPEQVRIENLECAGNYVFNDKSIPFQSYTDFQKGLPNALNNHMIKTDMLCNKTIAGYPTLSLEASVEFSNVTITEETTGKQTKTFRPELSILFHTIKDLKPSQFYRPGSAGKGSYLGVCISSYDNDVSTDSWVVPGSFDNGTMSVFTCFNSTTDLTLWQDLESIGQINGSISTCAVDLCVREYKGVALRNGHMAIKDITEIPLEVSSPRIGTGVYNNVVDPVTFLSQAITYKPQVPGTKPGSHYKMGGLDLTWLKTKLESTVQSEAWVTYALAYLWHTGGDFDQLFNGIADVISTILSSPQKPSSNNVTGIAFGPQIFVPVHWAWFFMPLTLVLASIYILSITILQSQRRKYLFKTSILPTVFLTLGDCTGGCGRTIGARGSRFTDGDLRKISDSMRVRLVKSEQGILKLSLE